MKKFTKNEQLSQVKSFVFILGVQIKIFQIFRFFARLFLGLIVVGNVFRSYSNIYDAEVDNCLSPLTIFAKKIYLRCSAGF